MTDQPNFGGWSWDTPQRDRPPAKRALPPEDDFRRTVLFTIAGAVVPGVGLIAARRRVAGGVILGLFVAALIGLGLWFTLDRQGFLANFVTPARLRLLMVGLPVVAVIWVGVVIATHLSLRGRPTGAQRAIGGVLVGILAFAVAAPMAVAARYSYDTGNALG